MTTQPERRQTPPPAVLAAGGVWLPAEVCHPLWLVLRAHLEGRRADGGRVRPEIAAALDTLRAAGLAHLTDTSPNGHDQRTSTDITASSDPRRLVTTEELSRRLGVTGRHARRLAAAEGITPAARGLWHPDDARHLTRTHRKAT
ncbi:hypothetical protein [Streptomyces sp. AC512_CC834]|uniref:hypothetical protein n=1 Tax=Streptomyces sp. AC512_CC834 TaxID=2823691 RepID=UPI001C260591|nr:hypothetical protein [Streptomyces sp. AC512_CC834]